VKSAICSLAIFALTATGWAQSLPTAASQRRPELPAYFGVSPWTEGTHADAAIQSTASLTIPMSTYSFLATKDGKTYNGTMVGGSPFASPLPGPTPINAVVVPLKISVGSATFDPTTGDSCNSTSTVSAFNSSPLVVATSIGFNGTAITAQYIDGFRQAEFASLVGGSGYTNPISYTTAPTYTISSSVVGRHGTTYSSGCSLLGILSYSWLDSYLRNTVMPSLTPGVISPTSFVIFLMKNVVESTSNHPSVSTCCILGYHGASGSPVQTYSAIEWDTTGLFGSSIHDASIAAHEIGEWMDDPLGTNPTPAWGGIGQVSSCQSNLENGDPLTGTNMATVNGYHFQELAFFSWYYNAQSTPSLGTNGKFSGNGTFSGPAKVCPPGGTY